MLINNDSEIFRRRKTEKKFIQETMNFIERNESKEKVEEDKLISFTSLEIYLEIFGVG